mmetsp:Transcript_7697/g.16722  ORF Transcript_7697/g.16722 Transcript_7697/m.16722 type:complete len:109 (-) Transcript_7697:249-575(-)|eukprot:CAMPEP_0170590020 /NCGR_PEP_ID=MMETSP0224-20130122/11648_1 /TAXON_ID=285029 /ORGANISM="Togula jolla, Strain CCCM 725" /LENGTH=108 /DNA_ID=CAMNT_0010913791 /DNA_START=58 /DNA_END=384 /DNA_ORIENTATION=+
MQSRPATLALVVLALCFLVVPRLVTPDSGAFLGPPSAVTRSTQAVQTSQAQPEALALGAAAGLLAVEPAQASLLYDEILPVSYGVAFATIWGIVLGFVLLRLQEAFPE